MLEIEIKETLFCRYRHCISKRLLGRHERTDSKGRRTRSELHTTAEEAHEAVRSPELESWDWELLSGLSSPTQLPIFRGH